MVTYLQFINSNRFTLRSLIFFASKHFFSDRLPGNDYEREHLRLAKYMFRRALFCIFYVWATFSLVMVGPIYAYIAKGSRSFPTGVILPFIDVESENGFALNAVSQGGIGLVAGAGMIGVEIFFSIADCTLSAMAELTVFHLKAFSGRIERQPEALLMHEFRKILIMLDDIKSYIDILNDIFYWKFLVQPTSANLSVAIGIFSQYTVNVRR